MWTTFLVRIDNDTYSVNASAVGRRVKEILWLRKQDEDEHDEHESLLDLYLRAMEAAESPQESAA